MQGKDIVSDALKGVSLSALVSTGETEKSLFEALGKNGTKLHTANRLDTLLQTMKTPAQALLIEAAFCDEFHERIKSNPAELKSLRPEIIVLAFDKADSDKAAYWARVLNGYLIKFPANCDELSILIERALDAELLKKKLMRYESGEGSIERFGPIVVKSPEMKDVVRLARILATRDDCILFIGPIGTGKELTAHTIHEHSFRRHSRFFSLNCRSFTNEELEVELFGRGEDSDNRGAVQSLLELADGGILFLDEIGVIAPTIQGKLYRFLNEGIFTPFNSRETRTSDVRIFAATSQPLNELVAKGGFDEKLYFRLNRYSLHLPALRRRIEDIPVLVKQFLNRFSPEHGDEAQIEVNEETLKMLMDYHWPGNLHELENVLDFASLVAGKGPIEPKHLPKQFHDEIGSLFIGASLDDLQPMSEIERRYIIKVMEAANGNKVKAAQILDINRATLHRKLHIYERMKESK